MAVIFTESEIDSYTKEVGHLPESHIGPKDQID